MKRKFLEIKKYLKEDSENPAWDITWMIWTIINFPFVIIHELCHFIAICLTFTNVEIDPKRWYFFARQEIPYINNEGKPEKRVGLGWAFPVALIDNHPLQVMIVGGAPIIGVLFQLFLCFYVPLQLNFPRIGQISVLYLLLFWFVITLRITWLSEDDQKCVKLGWKWIIEKISPILLKIKKLFVHL